MYLILFKIVMDLITSTLKSAKALAKAFSPFMEISLGEIINLWFLLIVV